MPASDDVAVKRQTIKQAKAAFKTRGRPTIPERERKQIERAVELDRRAWRLKEQQRRKAEALKRKQERELQEKEVVLGSQMRCDQFGNKSSQFHLGAFFGAGTGRRSDAARHKLQTVEESYEVDGVDDQTLLSALASPDDTDTLVQPQSPRSRTNLRFTKHSQATVVDDIGIFWDELGSSTQICRELMGDDGVNSSGDANKSDRKLCITSFGSGDFDFSVEELEELEASAQGSGQAKSDTATMPPAAVPAQHFVNSDSKAEQKGCERIVNVVPQHRTRLLRPAPTEPLQAASNPERDRSLMPPPSIFSKPRRKTPSNHCAQAQGPKYLGCTSRASKLPTMVDGPAALGCTMSELESFIDDDLQLTQNTLG